MTEVTPEAKIFAQTVSEGPKLEQLMREIRTEFSTNPPLAGAYQPKRGELCAAKFVDNEWYRAKVEKMSGSDVQVLYVDYGNRATIPKAKTGQLPATFTSQQPFAKEYSLALCQLAPDVSQIFSCSFWTDMYQFVCFRRNTPLRASRL